MIEPKIIHLQSDTDGNWEYQVPNEFQQGVHTAVLVDDDTGHETFTLFEVLRAPSYLSFFFSLLALLLLVLIILFSIKNIRLIKKLRRQKRGTTWFSRIVIFISVGLICILGYVNRGLIDLINDDLLRKTDNPLVMEIVEKKDWKSTVSGQLVDPLSQKMVEGVDLVYNDIFIHTGDAGQFVFIDMDLNEGIKFTHPLLIRTLRYAFSDGDNFSSTKIYFNVEMFNTLISIVNLESRGDIDGIYDQYLGESVKSKVKKMDYIENYEQFFHKKDIVLQELVFGHIDVLTGDELVGTGVTEGTVVKIQLENDNKFKEYLLRYTEKGWELL